MSKFNVGDIVIGNDLADELYSITQKGTMWEVTKVFDDGEINICNTDRHEFVEVTEKAFDLYKSKDYTFRVGDKVRLSPNVKVGITYGGLTYLEGMPFSDIREIQEIASDGNYLVGAYYYSKEMLIPARAEVVMADDMHRAAEVVVVRGEKWQVSSYESDKIILTPYSDTINVGDTVKITNNGHSYNTSLKWFNEIIEATHIISKEKAEEYRFRFAYDGLPKNGTEYKVLGKSTNAESGRSNKTIYLICRDTQVYIIGEKGVEKVNG